MLKTLRDRYTYHIKAAKHSLNVLYLQGGSSLLTILALAIIFTLPALFLVFCNNVSSITERWHNNHSISAYLKVGLSAKEEKSALSQIKQVFGVESVELKTPAEALQELKQQEGMQDILSDLPINPLPALIQVTPDPKSNSPEAIQKLVSQLQSLPFVDQIKIDMQWVNRLDAILKFLRSIAQGFMVILGASVILIVGNTLRMTVQSRHEEIQVLKLIGAGDNFILRPFLYSGIWFGLASAIVTIIIVDLSMLILSGIVNRLANVYQMHYDLLGLSLKQILGLLIISLTLGWLGAKVSVRKQLSAIEPCN